MQIYKDKAYKNMYTTSYNLCLADVKNFQFQVAYKALGWIYIEAFKQYFIFMISLFNIWTVTATFRVNIDKTI